MIVDRINALVSQSFNVLVWPVVSLGPAWTMIYLSAITGIVCVWIFGKTSNQQAIESIKNHISGNLIGVRLFQDDLRVFMNLQKKLLGLTFRYMAHSFIPMLFMFIPVTLILIQMNEWYDSRALKNGETAILKVRVEESQLLENISVKASSGIRIDSPPVRIPAQNECVWRLKAIEPGTHHLSITAANQTIYKKAVVDGKWYRVSPERGTSLEARVMNPSEPMLNPGQGVQSIVISYPKPPLEILGLGLHWLVWFFVLSMIFGFSCKGILGVKI